MHSDCCAPLACCSSDLPPSKMPVNVDPARIVWDSGSGSKNPADETLSFEHAGGEAVNRAWACFDSSIAALETNFENLTRDLTIAAGRQSNEERSTRLSSVTSKIDEIWTSLRTLASESYSELLNQSFDRSSLPARLIDTGTARNRLHGRLLDLQESVELQSPENSIAVRSAIMSLDALEECLQAGSQALLRTWALQRRGIPNADPTPSELWKFWRLWMASESPHCRLSSRQS